MSPYTLSSLMHIHYYSQSHYFQSRDDKHCLCHSEAEGNEVMSTEFDFIPIFHLRHFNYSLIIHSTIFPTHKYVYAIATPSSFFLLIAVSLLIQRSIFASWSSYRLGCMSESASLKTVGLMSVVP